MKKLLKVLSLSLISLSLTGCGILPIGDNGGADNNDKEYAPSFPEGYWQTGTYVKA